jgi:hypothetical protein
MINEAPIVIWGLVVKSPQILSFFTGWFYVVRLSPQPFTFYPYLGS